MATGNCKSSKDKQPHFLVELWEEDIRLVYNAIDFYHKNRPNSSERPEYMQEPTKHLEYMKQTMMTIMMESSFQKNK